MNLIKKELKKYLIFTPIVAILLSYGIIISPDSLGKKIILIIIIILISIAYFFLLKSNLKQIKNEHDYNTSEYKKEYKKKIKDTQRDLEKRGLTFSGEAIEKLGSLAATKNTHKGEIQQNYDDYMECYNEKFRLDIISAKYTVIINLLNFKK